MMKILASIIIRTKNEERWIEHCLKAVYAQKKIKFEVIIVDNFSDDKTLEKVKNYPCKIVKIKNFFPGKAINLGIQKSKGNVIVCLSGHCIPSSNLWLKNLVDPLKNKKIVGVYGRQEPMSFSSDRDKRDLLTTFGLDPVLQKKDSYFHNANSAIKKEVWKKIPFDSVTPHIEDRLWGYDVISKGYELYYQPSASVYHYHGIHHDDNPIRRTNIVKILESCSEGENSSRVHQIARPSSFQPSDLNIIAMIPIMGKLRTFHKKNLIDYTINHCIKSKFVDDVYVITDNKSVYEKFRKNKKINSILRPKRLSSESTHIVEVYKYALHELENKGIFPDVCLLTQETYPFRQNETISKMIERFVRNGNKSLMAVKPEKKSIWLKKDSKLEAISPFVPRNLKTEEYLISLFGLGFVTYPQYIRDQSLGLDDIDQYLVDDPIESIELRDLESLKISNILLKKLTK